MRPILLARLIDCQSYTNHFSLAYHICGQSQANGSACTAVQRPHPLLIQPQHSMQDVPIEAEPDYSPVDMTQIKDKGPDISVVDDQKHVRAPLKVVEEEFEKRKAGEAVMTSSVSRSIMDTVSEQLYWSFLGVHVHMLQCAYYYSVHVHV